MRVVARYVIAMMAAVFLFAAAVMAQQYTVDRKTSDALSAYLKDNRLPLVGAQVLQDTSGTRRLVLYGYVATQLGKDDAEQKAVKYLNSPGIQVTNRIAINPEVGKMGKMGRTGSKRHGSRADQPAEPSSGGKTFDQVMDAIQRHGVQAAPGDADFGPPQ
jgi:hypothetical protein